MFSFFCCKKEKVYTQNELDSMTVTELRAILKKMNLPVYGTKADLVQRILDPEKPIIVRKKIPNAVRNALFTKYCGQDNLVLCYVCGIKLQQQSMQCGHYISVKNGGENTLSNLVPICQGCNTSIGPENMDVYMNRYKIPEQYARK
jgi:5-methylcytosine-specific restriction endonuclease McrA